jgi:hypothetical protein
VRRLVSILAVLAVAAALAATAAAVNSEPFKTLGDTVRCVATNFTSASKGTVRCDVRRLHRTWYLHVRGKAIVTATTHPIGPMGPSHIGFAEEVYAFGLFKCRIPSAESVQCWSVRSRHGFRVSARRQTSY